MSDFQSDTQNASESPEQEQYPPQITAILAKKGTGDITDVEVSLLIDHLVNEDNINWGEIADVPNLYALADRASHLLGGVPDCILKPAVSGVLMLQIQSMPCGWTKDHMDKLLKMWKAEMLDERPNKRETKAVLETRVIQSFEERRPKRHRGKKFAKHQMGLSGLLAHARNTLRIGNRKHEIEDNGDGGVEIDGEPLTFESWSRMTGGEAEDVVAASGNFDNKINPTPSIELAAAEKMKRDLEEGELSDDDFPLKKRNRHRYDSDTDSDDEEESKKRQKKTARAAEREEQRNTAAVNAELMKQRFDTIYKFRLDAINYMSVEQKVQMLHSLRMARRVELYDDEMTRCVDLAKFLAIQ